MINGIIKTIKIKKIYPFNLLYAFNFNEEKTEFLALLFADHPSLGYYYAHMAKHPKKSFWISCVVYSPYLIIGQTADEWLRNFHYWITVRLAYEPVSNKIASYSYAESITLEKAIEQLEKMINEFNTDAIYEDEDDNITFPANPQIIEFYGITDYRSEDGEYPPVPKYNRTIFH